MTKEIAKELIEKWVKRQINLHGAENFKLPVKDEIIYSYYNANDIVEYSLLYCISVYVAKDRIEK
jgi:hypothetical protein